MPRQAAEFQTVNISGGIGGNGGRGGEQGGSGGVGEGPTTNFGVLNADNMHFVIQNHWPDHACFRPSEGASYESSDTSYNDRNDFNFHGVKRRREETEDGSDSSLPTQRMEKRRRLNDDDECEVIPSRNLKLIHEIGSGPGYLLHAGQNKGHAVIVKVFNRGPRSKVRQQLEATVALSKGIMHPNVLRLLGISSPESCSHFIVYENGKLSRLKLRVRLTDGESVHWQNAEGPLAMALKTDLKRSITIGFKMVAGLSAGLNHLLVQGVFAKPIGVENFDIFLDVDDRFVISVHPQSREEESDIAYFQERESTWTVFNALCSKVLTSANRVLHYEEITRDPTILDVGRAAASENSLPSLFPLGSVAPQNTQEGLDVPPRREYVWRTIDRGRQSLENIARRINLGLNMDFSSLPKMNWTDRQSPHRCAGYMREEITLTTTILDSAVVAHDVPSPSEHCLICNEIVDVREKMCCECGDPAPGTQSTIKCQVCKFWSHSVCVGNSKYEFTCRLCIGGFRGSWAGDEVGADAAGMEVMTDGAGWIHTGTLQLSMASDKEYQLEEEEGDERACKSPAPAWPCTGWNCRDPAHAHDDDKAEVISLASCKDSQLMWESSGGSMTQEFGNILEEQEAERQFREAQDKDKDGAESVDSRLDSTNKRRKRGARKRKGGSQPSSSPKDETLENLATASLALAHEISRASQKSNTTHSSTSASSTMSENSRGSISTMSSAGMSTSAFTRRRLFEPPTMYPIPPAMLDGASPVPPPPKLHQHAKTQTPKPAPAPAPPAVVSDSTPAAPITKKPSKWKLFGKSSAAALGRISPVEESTPVPPTTANNVINLMRELDAAPAPNASTLDEWPRGRRARLPPPPGGFDPAARRDRETYNSSQSPHPNRESLVVHMRSTRTASPNSTLSGRTTGSSSTMSGSSRGSMSTMSSAGMSTSAFTRYSNTGVRSMSATVTSWRTTISESQPPPALNTDIPVNIMGIPWEVGQLPRGQYPDPVGDIFGSPPVRQARTRKPNDLQLGTIAERPPASQKSPDFERRDTATSTSDLSIPGSPRDEEGDGPEKVPKAQINALAKMLSALRR
ncbi:hypothetical protein MSAN_01162600 [Mycena sanguinolenta]|uniref:Protein kinase domain-containing protein n=1 Tax=Mycena sanguinolenta TaxID=230812 RepID=A0A8H7D743_9AGAR|nr:hypothetical protein MSAN_01162600 [Mycena sanguinolenta]